MPSFVHIVCTLSCKYPSCTEHSRQATNSSLIIFRLEPTKLGTPELLRFVLCQLDGGNLIKLFCLKHDARKHNKLKMMTRFRLENPPQYINFRLHSDIIHHLP